MYVRACARTHPPTIGPHPARPLIPPYGPQVHHFTLYDMRARGFVRPYCLAFVTLHPDKIMKDFESLRDDFSRCVAAGPGYCFRGAP